MRFCSRQFVRFCLQIVAISGLALTAWATNAVPLIQLPLNPTAVVVGSAGFTLTVHGYGFTPGSEVRWNGSARTTTYISSQELTAAILSNDVKAQGTAAVTVANTTPGGGTSNVAYLPVGISKNSIGSETYTDAAAVGTSGVATGDFNGDGNVDIVTANSDNTVSVLLGNGNGTFQSHVDYSAGSGAVSVAVGDFNGDGVLDLAVADQTGNTVTILKGLGNGTFQTEASYATGTGPVKVAVADMNHDGNLDLIVADSGSNQISVLLGKGDLTFQTAIQTSVSYSPLDLAIGDLDLDGVLDVVAVMQCSANCPGVWVLRGDGDGTFKTPGEYDIEWGATAVVLADLNGDGYPDVIATAGSDQDEVEYFQTYSGGRLKPGVGILSAYGPTSVQVGDFNGDGFLDVAAVDVGRGQISFAFGNGGGSFGNNDIFTYNAFTLVGSKPLEFATADFNNDGQLDFAVSENGSNGIDAVLQTPATLSAAAVSFGSQLLGTTSTSQQVTIYNAGGETMNIGSIAVGAPFSETNNCGSSLASAATCTVTLLFTPTKLERYSGTLTITDDAPNSPQTSQLTGDGTLVWVTPASYNFGTVAVGSSAQFVATVTSVATDSLKIIKLSAGGGVHEGGKLISEISQTNNCGTSIPPKGTCTVTVTFAPTVTGAAGGNLTLTTNGGQLQVVDLSGTGQ